VVAAIAVVTLFNEGKLDTFTSGEGDEGLLGITNHENVGKTGGERVTTGVLDVSDLVRTGVVLNVLEDTDTSHVVSTSGENGSAVIELDNTINITSLKVKLDGVVLLDVGVGETDGAAVVCDNIWDLVLSKNLSGDFDELEASLLSVDGVGHEAALNVVEHAEVLAGLVDGNNILETEGELVVTSDFTVNLDVLVSGLADLKGLLLGKSVLKSVAEEHGEWDALTELVGAGSWAGSVHATELIKAPVGGCEHSLQVLLGSSCHL